MDIAPGIWIAMAVVAQVIWACGNYLDNYLLKRYRNITQESGPGTIIFISSFTAAFVAFCIAIGAGILPILGFEGRTELSVTPLQALKGLSIGVLQICWMIAYLYALDESDETQSVPLFQSVPIFALLIGVHFDEIPPLIHIIGSLIIIAGALVLNFHLSTMRLNKSVIVLMLGASFMVALIAFLFKNGAEATNFFAAAFWLKLGLALAGITVCYVVPSYRRQFNHVMNNRDWTGLTINIVNEVCDRVARLIFFGAIMLGPSVMSVQATAAYQPMFIFLIGLLLARNGSAFHAEHYTRDEVIKKGCGVALIAVGSYFIFT
ncbi:MAG TPA: EamA family transporter [Candidatus Paceibacterota bacterium]